MIVLCRKLEEVWSRTIDLISLGDWWNVDEIRTTKIVMTMIIIIVITIIIIHIIIITSIILLSS